MRLIRDGEMGGGGGRMGSEKALVQFKMVSTRSEKALVQFKMVSMRSEKALIGSSPSLRSFPNVTLAETGR